MKVKKKAAIAATVFTAAMNFSACNNYGYNVYGPPLEEWEYEETDTEIESNDDTTQSETGTNFDISEETDGDEQQ